MIRAKTSHFFILRIGTLCLFAFTTFSLLDHSVLAEDTPSTQSETKAANVLKLAWRGPEGKLEVYDNSNTYGSAVDVNSNGAILGVHETASPNGMILSLTNFYCDDKRCFEIPKLDKFSNVSLSALSDQGTAVGYASRAPGNPNGSLIGAIWDVKTNKTTALNPIEGEGASHAIDISADGQLVVGYSTGAEPARTRPCVWTRSPEGDWSAEALKTKYQQNPYLITGGIRISPNGKYIAACCTEKTDGYRFDNHIVLWERIDNTWKGEQISEVSARIGHVNNDGHVVVNVNVNGKIMPHFIREPGKLEEIALLEGDDSGAANFIDRDGVIYGESNDPSGPEGGPTAFSFDGKETSTPFWASKAYYSAITAGTDDGILVGNIDVIIKGGSLRLAGQDKELIDDSENQESGDQSGSELTVKTLAFRWTPSSEP